MKFRIISSIIAVIVVLGLYVLTAGDDGYSAPSSSPSSSSEFGSDVIGTMK